MPTVSASTNRSPHTSRYACLSCRQRKLKCDRTVPCSNCTARSVNCRQQETFSSTRVRGVRKLQESQSLIPDIISRLDHIEAFINRTRECESDKYHSRAPRNEVNTPDGDDNSVASCNDVPDPGGHSESIRTESGLMATISTSDTVLVCLPKGDPQVNDS
jgi:hypothetical protein